MRAISLSLLLPLIVCACAQTREIRTIIHKDRHTEVELLRVVEGEEGSTAGDYSHPHAFNIENLKYILKGVSYEDKSLFGWAAARAVFSASELYRLAPYLVEGFAKAGPGDEVVFSSTSAKPGALFSSKRFTNGRMFVKAGKLNCLFANINTRDEASEAYDGDPRKRYGGASSRLVTNDLQSLVEGEGGVHYNWVKIEIDSALAEKASLERIIRMRAEPLKAIEKRIEREKVRESVYWEEWAPDKALPEK
jgi:hypothetical protein